MKINSSVDSLRQWMVSQALPLWGTTGFDAISASFVERLDFKGAPQLDVPRRTMVQARQISVFAQAALLGWWPQGRLIALAAAETLVARHFRSDGDPGWVFAVQRDGTIADRTRDLYAHAFALYGLAWAYRLDPQPHYRDVALGTLADLDQCFRSPTGGYFTKLPPDPAQRRQNPHMHHFEALLAWYDATGEASFLARAGEIHGLMVGRFFQPRTGTLSEYFDATWSPEPGVSGRICEPGHHYEWCWLLRRYGARIGRAADQVADALYAHADRYGFDAAGVVVDELLDDGTVHKASRRCWPHTEAIKANALVAEAGEARAVERAAHLIDVLMANFLGRPVAGGWIDHIDRDGTPLAAFMPASTLYHVALAAFECDRVWGRTAR